MHPTLTRYIVREVSGPFALTLLVATFMLLMNKLLRLTELLVNKGVPAADVALLIAYIMPRFLSFTVPVALFLAVMIAFGRMNGDSEIIALKASGVSLRTMLAPVLVIGALLTGATAYLTLYALPHGNRALETLLFDLARTRATVALSSGVFNDDFGDLTIYADAVDDRAGELRGLMLYDEKRLERPLIIVAERGRIYSAPDDRRVFLRMEKGEVHAAEIGGDRYQTLAFASYDVNLTLGGAFDLTDGMELGPGEMTMTELVASIDRYRSGGVRPGRELVELHERLSLPFACLAFAVLAIPLAIAPPRAGRSGGFLIGIVFTAVFFGLTRVGHAAGRAGTVPAWIAVWMPVAVIGTLAAFLFHQALRERRFFVLVWIDAAGTWIRARVARGKAAAEAQS